MPRPTGFLARIAWAVLCGIVAFLVVLGIGLLITSLIKTPAGQSYGNEVAGLAAVIGLIYGVYVFLTGRTGTPV